MNNDNINEAAEKDYAKAKTIMKIHAKIDSKSNRLLQITIIAFIVCLILKLQLNDDILSILDSVLGFIRSIINWVISLFV